ncbi:MAG: response regulator [Candidatus Omnitrophica bacterium]|nr:response regulator [Candidatus Omnitrophota bacterium]MDD5238141.1 response regulator [Candidatus Omnitrophota bacterium]
MEKIKSRIMVVDDELDILNTLKEFLSRKGYEVIGTPDAREALDVLKETGVDLILLDILMPHLKGTELARIIKNRYPDTKIIVITAHPSEGVGLYKDNLFEALFIKPFKLERLNEKITEVLNITRTHDSGWGKKQPAMQEVIFTKAKLLFVGVSTEIYDFLNSELRQLVYSGQNYDVDAAFDEKEFFKKIKSAAPDIVIFDSSYLDSLDYFAQETIRSLSGRAKEVISLDLSPSICEYGELVEFIENIKSICIKNKLIEIKYLEN